MKIAQKVTAAGSLAALCLSSQDAEATIVHVDDSPLTIDFTLPGGTEVDWDVDGEFGRDFYLQRGTGFGLPFIDLDSFGANGRGFVNNDSTGAFDLLNLPNGLIVGPSLATGYFFGVDDQNVRSLFFGGVGYLAYGDVEGFTSGDPGFAGFAFDANGTTLYGWAELTIDFDAPGTATISEWAYEDSGAAIAVGDTGSAAAVPESSSLALMALGAAGVTAWRMRRKKQTVETEE